MTPPPPQAPQAPPEPGLCARCAFGERVETARGSIFWRCVRSDGDRAFPRYPPLPVRRCPGFQPDGEMG